MRKIFTITVAIIGILLIGVLIYFVVVKIAGSNSANNNLNKKNGTSSQLQSTGSQLKIVSKEPIFDYWAASSTQDIIYIGEDGKIGKIGQNNFASEQSIAGLHSAQLSPDGQKILVAFGDPHQPQLSIFDLIASSWSPLPLEIKSAAWSSEGKRLAVVINQNGQNNLLIIDLAKYLSSDQKQNQKASTIIIKNFSLQDMDMGWMTPDEIIFTDKPSGLVEGSAWRLNFAKPTNTTFTEIVPPGKGLMIKWLKENLGIKLQNQQSSLINWAGQTINNFSLMVLPDKCVLKSESLYCFLFTPTSPKTTWPDDYLQKAIYTKDDLYKFDLNNPAKPELIFNSASEGKTIDATDVKTLGNQILFINRYDNQLYSLEVNE